MSPIIKKSLVIFLILSISIEFSHSEEEGKYGAKYTFDEEIDENNQNENDTEAFDKEQADLKNHIIEQHFVNSDKSWTYLEYRPHAINYFVRDDEESFMQLKQKFDGPLKDELTDMELSQLASIHLLGEYMKLLFKDKDSITNDQAKDFMDMGKFDKWTENMDDDLMAEIDQYIPEKYKKNVPLTDAEYDKKYPDQKEVDWSDLEGDL